MKTLHMWGDHMVPIPYKVWGIISYIRHEELHMWGTICTYRGTMIPVPYKVKVGPYIHVGDLTIPVPFKVRGTIFDSYIQRCPEKIISYMGGPSDCTCGGPSDTYSI